MESSKTKPSRRSRVASIAVNLLFALILLSLAGLGAARLALDRSGWDFYEVVSGSMEPALHEGEVVAIKRVPPHEVEVGDVIAFRAGELPAPVVHRVAGIKYTADVHSVFVKEGTEEVLGEKYTYAPRTFFTKGDANSERDGAPVTEERFIGVQESVVPEPAATLITFFGRGNLTRLAIAMLAVFIVWQGTDIVKEGIGKKRAGQQMAPAPPVEDTLG